MDIAHEIKKGKKEITAEGHSLLDLLKGEAGIHLFYKAHQNPLPIKISINNLDTKKSNQPNYKVIRIYDGANTLTDLRTRFSNDVNITPEEFKFLVFGGVDKRLRKNLRIL